MDAVGGTSLRRVLNDGAPLGSEAAMAVLKDSLLATAHAADGVQGDIRPENILVDGDGMTTIGVGGARESEGMAPYRAPECRAGEPATAAADVYAVTAVFYECLTGAPPFTGTPDELAEAHRSAPVPLGVVPEPLRMMIAHGMAKDPGARPSSASALLKELNMMVVPVFGPEWERTGRGRLAELAGRSGATPEPPARTGSAPGATGAAAATGPRPHPSTLLTQPYDKWPAGVRPSEPAEPAQTGEPEREPRTAGHEAPAVQSAESAPERRPVRPAAEPASRSVWPPGPPPAPRTSGERPAPKSKDRLLRPAIIIPAVVAVVVLIVITVAAIGFHRGAGGPQTEPRPEAAPALPAAPPADPGEAVALAVRQMDRKAFAEFTYSERAGDGNAVRVGGARLSMAGNGLLAAARVANPSKVPGGAMHAPARVVLTADRAYVKLRGWKSFSRTDVASGKLGSGRTPQVDYARAALDVVPAARLTDLTRILAETSKAKITRPDGLIQYAGKVHAPRPLLKKVTTDSATPVVYAYRLRLGPDYLPRALTLKTTAGAGKPGATSTVYKLTYASWGANLPISPPE